MTEEKIVPSICRACLVGCGIYVHVRDGKVVKVEGIKDHPVNKGGLCAKGLASVQHQNNPARLKYPLKRVGKRGENKWERISWDEALEITAAKLNSIKESYGPEAVAFVRGQGPGWEVWWDLWIRLAMAFGSPNITSNGNICYNPRSSAGGVTYGGYAEADLERNNGIIILWGYNPAYTNPPACRRILDAKERGAKLVVIDPVFTPIAAKADMYIRLRPGTDAALALAMINVIVNNGLYDKKFVEEWTFGFDKLKEHVRQYTPEYVEKITSVPSSVIVDVAKKYATIKPAAIIEGNGIEQSTNSYQTLRAIAILKALTGNIDVPGGNIIPLPARSNKIWLLEKMPNHWEKSVSKHPMYARFYFCCQNDIIDAVLTEKPYPIKAIMVFGTPLVTITPRSIKVIKALEKLDFLAVFDIYMTPVAEFADIVFPAATFFESEDFYCWRGGTAKSARSQNIEIVMWQNKVVEPLAECRSNWDFIKGLAEKLGLKEYFPWSSFEEYADFAFREMGLNIMVEELKNLPNGLLVRELPDEIVYRKYERAGFKTPSGKVEIYSSILEKEGYSPLPIYLEPAESPISAPHLKEKYPLVCNTGLKAGVYTHTQFKDLPWLKDLLPEPFAGIHPETAKKYDVSDGDYIIVESPRGMIRIKARVSEMFAPETVFITHGWREPMYNNLVDDESRGPEVGSIGVKAFLCRITKI